MSTDCVRASSSTQPNRRALFDLIIWVECLWVPIDFTQELTAADADVVTQNIECGRGHLRRKVQEVASRLLTIAQSAQP